FLSRTTATRLTNDNLLFIQPAVRQRCASAMIAADFSDKVLQLLASVAETDEVFANLDLPLYECQVLDSMRTVQLILMVEEEFGIKVSPAEFERETWQTPRKIIADLRHRMSM